MIRFLALCIGLIFTTVLDASCPVGAFEEITDSPVDTGAEPYFITYSSLVSNNLFAATASTGDDDVWVYKVNINTGAFTEVPGSAFTVGDGPYFTAFSPVFNGNIYAAIANYNDSTISVFTVNPSTGFFTEIAGSPFDSQGSGPFPLTYSPLLPGNLLFAFAGNFSDSTVSVYSVNPITGALNAVGIATDTSPNPYDIACSPLIGTNLFIAVACDTTPDNVSVFKVDITNGTLTEVTGSPFTAGTEPVSVAFSPLLNGNLFAIVTNYGSNNLSVFQVDTTTGFFDLISTTVTGMQPYSAVFSPLIGSYLFVAVANSADNSVSVYQMDITTGTLSPVIGSPFTAGVGSAPMSVAFSPILPGGLFAAVLNSSSDNISLFTLNLVIPTITTSSLVSYCNTPITINATINSGTPPFTLTWSDGFVQTTNDFSVTRTVMPSQTVRYQITSIVDSNGCIGVPSNTITITVLCSPTGCSLVC